MGPLGIFLLSLSTIVILMILGMPIAFVLGIVSSAIFVIKGYPLVQIPHMMTTGLAKFVLLVIPFFVLVGKLMNVTRLTDRIFDFANSCVGHLKGGLGQVNILSSLIFAGMSGSALADVQGLGIIEIKAMSDRGYPKEFAAAVTIASSTIGPIIPPSVPMVVYAAIAEVSVAKLFLGGVIPGILMTVFMMILVYFLSRNRNFPVSPRTNLREFLVSFLYSLTALIIPLILLAAILFGIATPTEIGAIAIVYILILGGVFFKDLNLSAFWQAVKSTVAATASILLIVSMATFYSKLLSLEQVPQMLVHYVSLITTSQVTFLLSVNVLFLILGCFLEPISIMVIILPILLPMVRLLEIDYIHFGVITVFNLMIGLITPPFGLCLYAVSDITKISVFRLARDVLPFLIPLIMTLLIITFFPKLIMLIPNLVR